MFPELFLRIIQVKHIWIQRQKLLNSIHSTDSETDVARMPHCMKWYDVYDIMTIFSFVLNDSFSAYLHLNILNKFTTSIRGRFMIGICRIFEH